MTPLPVQVSIYVDGKPVAVRSFERTLQDTEKPLSDHHIAKKLCHNWGVTIKKYFPPDDYNGSIFHCTHKTEFVFHKD